MAPAPMQLVMAALLAAVLVTLPALSLATEVKKPDTHHKLRPPPPHHKPPPVDCSKPGCVCNDPVLVGADGVHFYFHGHKDAHFCLVSDADLHVNAHFIGKRRADMPRDFTWVQSLGVLFASHQLYVGADKVAAWDGAVDHLTLALDGAPLALPAGDGAVWAAPSVGLTVTRLADANAVAVEVDGKLALSVRVVPVSEADNLKHGYGVAEDDCFAHLELGFHFPAGLTSAVSGVLGQTYGPGFQALRKLPGQLMPTMGQEGRYEASSLMAPDCAVSAFGRRAAAAEEAAAASDVLLMTGLKPMSCSGSSGMLCRR